MASICAGMADPGGLRAALSGRDARAAHAETAEFEPESFTDRDYEALKGAWAALGADAGAGAADGHEGEVEDDLSYVAPWGVELGAVSAPVLLVQAAATASSRPRTPAGCWNGSAAASSGCGRARATSRC